MNVDCSGNRKALSKLKKSACELKEALAAANCFQYTFFIESVTSEEDFNAEVSRHDFEKICKPIWDRMIPPLDEALTIAGLSKE